MPNGAQGPGRRCWVTGRHWLQETGQALPAARWPLPGLLAKGLAPLQSFLLEEGDALHGNLLDLQKENKKLQGWVEALSAEFTKLQGAVVQPGGQRSQRPAALQPASDAAAVAVEVAREA